MDLPLGLTCMEDLTQTGEEVLLILVHWDHNMKLLAHPGVPSLH